MNRIDIGNGLNRIDKEKEMEIGNELPMTRSDDAIADRNELNLERCRKGKRWDRLNPRVPLYDRLPGQIQIIDKHPPRVFSYSEIKNQIFH